MADINISGLPKEEVILALFENVYGKSDEAKQKKTAIIQFTPDQPGIYSKPHDYEISNILRHNQFIDYLGCIKLGMNFSENVINTDTYDRIHKPGENGVESATSVIEKLRAKIEHKRKLQSPPAAAAASSTSSYARSSFTATITKTNIETSMHKTVAEEKLTAFLGMPCRVNHLFSNIYNFEFSPEPSYETIQKYVALLANKGITVKAKAPSSLCGGLVNISAKLEFEGSLSDVATKLDSSPTASNSTPISPCP